MATPKPKLRFGYFTAPFHPAGQNPTLALDRDLELVQWLDRLGFDEAWIDSVLCTTCNDCLNVNRAMFVYNENKQAVIADIDAGPYADLVIAAEKCPARCIHPGKPQDPSEPNLDALIARAAEFN